LVVSSSLAFTATNFILLWRHWFPVNGRGRRKEKRKLIWQKKVIQWGIRTFDSLGRKVYILVFLGCFLGRGVLVDYWGGTRDFYVPRPSSEP
jgi:hypothetical protein